MATYKKLIPDLYGKVHADLYKDLYGKYPDPAIAIAQAKIDAITPSSTGIVGKGTINNVANPTQGQVSITNPTDLTATFKSITGNATTKKWSIVVTIASATAGTTPKDVTFVLDMTAEYDAAAAP